MSHRKAKATPSQTAAVTVAHSHLKNSKAFCLTLIILSDLSSSLRVHVCSLRPDMSWSAYSVKWMRDVARRRGEERVIYDDRHMEASERVLTILDTDSGDTGTYVCYLDNDQMAVHHVDVIDRELHRQANRDELLSSFATTRTHIYLCIITFATVDSRIVNR